MSEPGVGRGFGSRIASDSFVYGLGGIANQAVAILLVPIYARVLGDTGLGITSVLNSIISLSLMLVGLALPQAFFRWYLREAADHVERSHILRTTLAVRIAASLAGFALVLLAAVPLTAVLFGGENLLLFALAAPIVLFDSFSGIPLSFLRAERRSRDYVIISLTRAITGSVLIVLLVVVLQFGVVGVALGSAIAAALSAGIGAWVIWRTGMWRPVLDRDLSRAMLAFALPLVPAAVAGWTLNLADRPLLLAITDSEAVVGVYALGYTGGLVINALAIQPFSLAWGATFWEISRSDDAPRVFARTLTWFLAIASAAALFLSAIGTDVIRLLFTPDFEDSRYIVPFSAFAFVLYGAYTIVATGLSVVGRSGILATTMLIAAGVSLGLNLLLIPVLGMYGAAISTVAGYGLLVVLAGWQSQRLYPVPWQLGRAVVILGLAVALSALALLGPDQTLWRVGAILALSADPHRHRHRAPDPGPPAAPGPPAPMSADRPDRPPHPDLADARAAERRHVRPRARDGRCRPPRRQAPGADTVHLSAAPLRCAPPRADPRRRGSHAHPHRAGRADRRATARRPAGRVLPRRRRPRLATDAGPLAMARAAGRAARGSVAHELRGHRRLPPRARRASRGGPAGRGPHAVRAVATACGAPRPVPRRPEPEQGLRDGHVIWPTRSSARGSATSIPPRSRRSSPRMTSC